MLVKKIYSGRVVHLNIESVTLPNGVQDNLEVVRHSGAAAVVPLYRDGRVVLIKQYRHAAGGTIVEVPAGRLEKGESPEACARRELSEETGLSAKRWHPLLSILTTPGFSDEEIHIYLARDLLVGEAHPEASESIEVVEMPLDRALEGILAGEIRDAKTIAALFAAAAFIQSEPSRDS